MKVRVIRDNCIGCGACTAICPEVFEMDDEGISTVINDNISDELSASVIESIESCPTAAIEEINDQEN